MILPGWEAGWLDVGSERDVFRQLGDLVIFLQMILVIAVMCVGSIFSFLKIVTVCDVYLGGIFVTRELM